MYSGLGLGLTITRLLVNTLGGDIAVKSRPGEGATFSVRLMLASVDRPTPPQAGADTGVYEGPRRTIMVVDDNEDHRAMMADILHPLGFNVMLAENGAACLEQTAIEPADLFLLDIRMPGIDGLQLLQQLQLQLQL